MAERAERSEEAKAERMEVKHRPASVANAIPIGVSLDRRDFSAGIGPVLWEMGYGAALATRHLLGVGNEENLETLRKMLMSHVRDNELYWDGAVLAGEAKQLQALTLAVDESKMPVGYSYRHDGRRALLIVEYPESQEVFSLLSELAGLRQSGMHLAVMTDKPAALPSSSLRNLGFRVCFAGETDEATSRDVVGDESAATLGNLESLGEGLKHAAVVYEEWLGHDPEHGTYRVDLPGRLFGRRRDVYVGGAGSLEEALAERRESADWWKQHKAGETPGTLAGDDEGSKGAE